LYVLVVSKHDDPVLGALAVDKQQASLADEIGIALTYRRQSKVTNAQNAKSDPSVKLTSLTVLTPSIQSFLEANSRAKFSILSDLVLHAERASTNPAATNRVPTTSAPVYCGWVPQTN